MNRKTVITIAAAVFVCGAGLVPILIPMMRTPSRTEIRELQDEGIKLISAIEAYRNAHGSYPGTVDKMEETAIPTQWGAWKYSSDGTNFSLSIGDYPRYYFLMHWQRDKKAWYVDT